MDNRLLNTIPCYPSKKWINKNKWYIQYKEDKKKARKKVRENARYKPSSDLPNITTIKKVLSDIIEPENIKIRKLTIDDIDYNMDNRVYDIIHYHNEFQVYDRLIKVFDEYRVSLQSSYVGLILTIKKGN